MATKNAAPKVPGAQSNSRSGLAKDAIMRATRAAVEAANKNKKQDTYSIAPPKSISGTSAYVQPTSSNSNLGSNTSSIDWQAVLNKIAKTPAVGTKNPGTTAPAPSPPQVDRTPTGQLQLPYDSEFAWNVLDARQNADAQILQLQQLTQQQEAQYANLMRDADLEYGDTQRRNLNSNAARGTAFSSAYTHDLGRTEDDYLRYTGDLSASHNLFKEQSDIQRQTILNALDAYIAQANAAYAERLSGEAGELGLGNQPKAPAPKASAKSSTPRIDKLKAQGLTGKQIIAKLANTKPGSGGAAKLSDKQLLAIGYSQKQINNFRKKNKKKK